VTAAATVRHIGRMALWVAAAALSCVIVLTIIWRFAPPVSTLMALRHVTGVPVDRRWVPLQAMSPHLVRAVIASEDGRFCIHHGIDWHSLTEVLGTAGGPRRGASTITMQTAKNLFLWHGRSYLRKALEVPLALLLDLLWPKHRILEVYLNIAEWGDGVFGAEAGAQYAFGASARALTPHQAALMATALPNPILRNPAKVRRGHSRLALVIAARARTGRGLDHCLELPAASLGR